TLLDYFPEDFLMVIDESHVTVPQIGGMYEGDMSRKRNLVEYGFRLPSACDNRPLTWEEFADRIGQTVYLSATPGPYELSQTQGEFVEQVIRPTELVDPQVLVKPTKGQIDDLIGEIRKRAAADERVLVTTLTKKMAEDLTDYLLELGIRVRYLHSEVDTLRRVELLRQLRSGDFDVLVGINLLREGLDLPEVSLVAILDADKEGFARQEARAGWRWAQLRCPRGPRRVRDAACRAGGSDPVHDGPDDASRPGPPVRTGGPPPRRDRRPEEGTARHGRRRRQVSDPSP